MRAEDPACNCQCGSVVGTEEEEERRMSVDAINQGRGGIKIAGWGSTKEGEERAILFTKPFTGLFDIL